MSAGLEVERLRALFRYNWWANERMLKAVSALTAEQYGKDLGSSFGSLRSTVTHVLWAEWIWLRRCEGESPMVVFDPADYGDPSAVGARWDEVRAGQEQFLARLTEARLERAVAYVNTRGERWSYPLWQVLTHVVNHSTYHRGQVTTMLRQLDAEPPATDFLLYYDEKGEAAGPVG